MKVYLASKSPRRKELLTLMGIAFDLLLVDIPEEVAADEQASDYSMRITREKLEAAWAAMLAEGLPPRPILCADTEVILDGQVLGKPAHYEAAFTMLSRLAGRDHEVITSVGIRYEDFQKISLCSTQVSFAAMTAEDIHAYLALGDYQGKSGSYGIQSYLGQFIRKIDGCFYSVMGLPLHQVRLLLDELENRPAAVEAASSRR